MKQYQLDGEVETPWCDSEEEALEAYNEAVAAHNARYRRESSHFAFLDGPLYPCGTLHENLGGDDGIRYQWVNPTRNRGMVYLTERNRVMETKP